MQKHYLRPPACRSISSATTLKTRKLGVLATMAVAQPRDVPIFLTVTRPWLTSTACTCDQGVNSRPLPMPCWLTLNGANVRVCPVRSEYKARGTSSCVIPYVANVYPKSIATDCESGLIVAFLEGKKYEQTHLRRVIYLTGE